MPRKMAIRATNTASADFFDSGLTMNTSVAAPSAKPKAIPAMVASHSGSCQSLNSVHVVTTHVMYADRVAISPAAKLRCPVPRNTTTRPRATSA
jgi:hypothetical protein